MQANGEAFSTVSLREVFYTLYKFGLPKFGLRGEVNSWRLKNLGGLCSGLCRIIKAKLQGKPARAGNLFATVIRQDGSRHWYGLASVNVVTTAGVNYLVQCFLNAQEPELFKYHGIGTGTNAESIADTALQTELTTQY